MKNYLQEGDTLTVAAPADVSSGDFVVVGGLYGVAEITALSGADVPIVREGVFTLPKTTGEAWSQGDQLYWDDGTSKFTKTAGSLTSNYGIAADAAASADTTGSVLIKQGS